MFHRDYKSFTEEKFLDDVDKEMIKGTFYQTNELYAAFLRYFNLSRIGKPLFKQKLFAEIMTL